jgi:hypothetical protein
MGFFDGVAPLFKGNKNIGTSGEGLKSEGPQEEADELTLSMDDEELLALAKEWETEYEDYNAKISKIQDKNEKYWAYGCEGEDKNNVDNLIFEALETFLPIATQRNPEPVVIADNTPEGEKLAKKVNKMLVYLADHLSLKLKLKRATRYWALHLLGVAKLVWNEEEEEIEVQIPRTKDIILDPNFSINDNMQYEGEYIGERIRDKASVMVEKFPKKKKEIEAMVNGKMGTIIDYTEWWTDDYVFWTLKDIVLDKARNPHWNYREERETVDEFGEPTMEEIPEFNHFLSPQKPYAFMSIFNLGDQPHDSTSLISQNIPNQKRINELHKQIEKNVKMMNGGMAISGEKSGLSKEESSRAGKALREGHIIYLNSGDPNTSIARFNQGSLPADVFNSLYDFRNELRSIFGVSGSTASGTQQEQTVRGKIIVRQQDQSRIGGGVTEFLEQFADRIFNYMLQMMMVYYDKEHVASLIGEAGADEYVTLSRQEFMQVPAKLTVSVKEGSLIPKDPLTKSSQAMDLANAGMLDPISLFEALDYPDPRGTAEKMYKWNNAPETLFQENLEGMDVVGQVQQAQQQAQINQQNQQAAVENAALGIGEQTPLA